MQGIRPPSFSVFTAQAVSSSDKPGKDAMLTKTHGRGSLCFHSAQRPGLRRRTPAQPRACPRIPGGGPSPCPRGASVSHAAGVPPTLRWAPPLLQRGLAVPALRLAVQQVKAFFSSLAFHFWVDSRPGTLCYETNDWALESEGPEGRGHLTAGERRASVCRPCRVWFPEVSGASREPPLGV